MKNIKVFYKKLKDTKFDCYYYIKEKIYDKKDNCIIGAYIRCNVANDDETRNNIIEQENLIEAYCKKNNIKNTIEYIDIGRSGTDNRRIALKLMIKELTNGKIQGIVVKYISKLYRNPIDMRLFLNREFIKNIQLHSLDNSIEEFIKVEKNFQDKVKFLYNNTQMVTENAEEDEEGI